MESPTWRVLRGEPCVESLAWRALSGELTENASIIATAQRFVRLSLSRFFPYYFHATPVKDVANSCLTAEACV